MKSKINLLAVFTFLILSCSSDKEDGPRTSSIVGSWEFSSLELDEGTTDTDLLLAEAYFIILKGQDCELVTFTFNDDNTLIAESSLGNVSTDFSLEGGIPCPTDTEIETAIWSLEGDQLTIVDAEGLSETFTITLVNDELTVPSESLSGGTYTGASAVFTRK
tara:strand:+ start:5818 stop:6303 length:486 start_codon:yes stop_codon:yes gene_type:complete